MEKEELKGDLGIEDIHNDIEGLRSKLQPYQLPILYIGIVVFILLILIVGVGLGGYKVCLQVGGFLDNNFYCHTDYYDKQQQSKQLYNDFIKLEIPP